MLCPPRFNLEEFTLIAPLSIRYYLRLAQSIDTKGNKCKQMEPLDIFQLVAAILSIVLSIVALVFSVWFFRESNVMQLKTIETLETVKQLASSNEKQSSAVTSKVVDSFLEDFRSRSNGGISKTAEEKLGFLTSIESQFKDLPAEERSVILREISGYFDKSMQRVMVSASPTLPGYDWGPFIRDVFKLEGKNDFLSVKWLHQTVYSGLPTFQEALQEAMRNGVLDIYELPNTKNPSHPTKCCKVNHANVVVQHVLSSTKRR